MTPDIRQVDKTSLISWQSNKYSVPMAYQSAKVAVAAKAGQLLIHDIASGDRIAEHTISFEKGQIIKNTHHYRDITQRVEALETVLEQQLGGSVSQRLCALLKASSPKIYKDQLLGATLNGNSVTRYPGRLSVAKPDHPTPARATSALAHYANLNGQSTGQGESHVVH